MRRVDEALRQRVKERLMKPSPPEGAHVCGPWGWGLSEAQAEERLVYWRRLLTIPGLTEDEVAHKMVSWGMPKRKPRR